MAQSQVSSIQKAVDEGKTIKTQSGKDITSQYTKNASSNTKPAPEKVVVPESVKKQATSFANSPTSSGKQTKARIQLESNLRKGIYTPEQEEIVRNALKLYEGGQQQLAQQAQEVDPKEEEQRIADKATRTGEIADQTIRTTQEGYNSSLQAGDPANSVVGKIFEQMQGLSDLEQENNISYQQMLQEFYGASPSSYEEFQAFREELMDSEMRDEVSDKAETVKGLQRQIEDVADEIRAQYGSNITESQAAAEIGKRTKPLREQLEVALDDYEIASSRWSEERAYQEQAFGYYMQDQAQERQQFLQMAEMKYGMNQQETQRRMQVMEQQLSRAYQIEDRAFQVALQEDTRVYQRALQLEDREYQANMKAYYDTMSHEQQIDLLNVQEELRLEGLAVQMQMEKNGGKPQAFQRKDGSVMIIDLYDPSNTTLIGGTSQVAAQNSPISTASYGGNQYFSNFKQITGGGGEHDQRRGIDLDGQMGDPIPASVEGEVVQVITGQGKSSTPSYGNFVDIKDKQGNVHRFAHLNDVQVQKGMTVQAGQQIGTMGNSGFTIAGEGGDGSHLDYSIQKGDGTRYKSSEISGYLDSLAGKDVLSPIARMVIDGDIRVDQIKDNVSDDAQIPSLMQEISSFRANNNIIDEDTQSVIDIARELKELSGATRGFTAVTGGIPLTPSRDINAKLERLKATLSMDNLVALKSKGATFGALSDQELRFISNQASALDLGMTPSAWKAEMDRIISALGGESPEMAEQQVQGNTFQIGEVNNDFVLWGQQNMNYSTTLPS